METETIEIGKRTQISDSNKKMERKSNPNQGDQMENNAQEVKLTIIDNILEQTTLPNAKLLKDYHRLEKDIKNIKKTLEAKIKTFQRLQEQINGSKNKSPHNIG
ncbi:hypothetical protein BKH41_01890 [Helicobacter sp. 12S02232-10]|uniref:hypothetical protein n=1 Tax=Helicobacter sp. 12S02232-10 TaxID=1476197 RepID=UPI000BA74A22|nr:hypothetical protein [Helicobacter sp. 12S02232-10]PAF49441.1 hypothetical protein BKH41_01890 [Helicobacter sp. 12S02232-10]